jgi:predicted secreted protein
MGWFNALVLFVIIWWTALFAVLPLGTQPSAAPDQASGWRGVPAQARIGRKLLITTGVSLVIWFACVAVIASGWLSFRSGFMALPND